ncbi:thiamine-phosphate kinase [Aquibacillus salsiterrae]|uniref:Thiamine-monophosphate kinase n=1 Tax=Aquibacillus salsiterrae TaxID=2950439 RepID=A0A9X3WEZ4_9BACI|nr:thiamine-phosphate kinase [Aquibacillus salsiterrae]MDC3418592.1 thiamine-phosphate kinase [Aquibacillus salsiterrae]
MDEFDFIKRIQPKSYKQSNLIKGIGDDAAVFRQSYQDTVTAVDTLVENVHFSRKTMEPYHIGYRALAANISDMAAMGCKPAFYLISIVIPPSWAESELEEIYLGMTAIARQFQMDLIGGDTVSGKELVISVTIIGFVDRNKARYRSDAKEGDVVFVTGSLGDSAAGFYLLSNFDQRDRLTYQYLINRHRMPFPRVQFASGLHSLQRVCLNDVSDGIASEANEIAEASHVTMKIDYEQLPIDKSLLDFSREQQESWVLSGGEDFELIGTVSELEWQKLIEIAAKQNVPVTAIGRVTGHDHKGKVFLAKDGQTKLLRKSGYTHLK